MHKKRGEKEDCTKGEERRKIAHRERRRQGWVSETEEKWQNRRREVSRGRGCVCVCVSVK